MNKSNKLNKLISEYNALYVDWENDYSQLLSENKLSCKKIDIDLKGLLPKYDNIRYVFKNIVRLRDDFAKSVHYKNYFELEMSYLHPLPYKQVNKMSNMIKEFKKIVKKTEFYKKEMAFLRKNGDINNNYLLFPAIVTIGTRSKQLNTGSIIDNIAKLDKRIIKIAPRIKVRYVKNLIKEYAPAARPNIKDKTVTIKLVKRELYNFYDELTCVHEYGHAIDLIDAMDKGKSLSTRELKRNKGSYYMREKKADKLKFAYINKYLTAKGIEKYMFNMLCDITICGFQFGVFNNPNEKYSKILGKCVSLYYDVKQEDNPLYFYYGNDLINSPLISTVHVLNIVNSFIKTSKNK